MAQLTNPAVVLPILGVIAGLAIMFLAMRVVNAKQSGGSPLAGALSNGAATAKLQGLLANPILQHIVAEVAQKAHDSGHAILDAAIVKMVPGLAPFVPVVNAAADQLSAKLSGGTAPVSPSPAPGTPADPLALLQQLHALLVQVKGSGS